MIPSRTWTAALAVIGDEILSGRTEDKNVARLATWLNDQGIRLAEVRIVPADTAHIGEAVNALRTSYDYLFTTGGIGPTHDDITIDAIAEAVGVPVVVHPEARRMLEDYYRPRGIELTEARLRMARVAEGAELLDSLERANPGISIGSYPFMRDGGFGANFVIRSEDGALAEACGIELANQLRVRGVVF